MMFHFRFDVMRPYAALLALGLTLPATAAELHIYSARHYPSDAALYDNYTRATGVQIKRVDADDAGILARLKAEGSASPADVILLVDAARLWRGEQDDLFMPITSPLLSQKIPPHLRAQPDPQGGVAWFGFSQRARVVVYNRQRINPADVANYSQLADPRLKGQVCLRSGSHPYNLSLFGAYLAHHGEAATQRWLSGVVANLARQPRGGDTDQIKAVASGECGVAISNSYYVARLMRSKAPADQAVMASVGVVFPNQATWGTHMNVAGGAVAAHAKNPQAALAFLAFLSTEQAQAHFADGNNEWPAVAYPSIQNPTLKVLSGGNFKADTLSVATIGANQRTVQMMLDRAGLR